jgi:acetylornithine/succinyldiaminopimelate/putrescine aminotransferase
MNLLEKDKKFIGRDGTYVPLEHSKSEGNFIIDSKGNRIIDFLSGWNVGNVGWGVEEIKREIRRFNGPDYVDPYSLYEPWANLAEILAKITPGKLIKSFRATGGTEAVEIALQASMLHTKRQKFVAIKYSYHGHSIGAMSLMKRPGFNFLDSYQIEAPLDAKAGKEVEKILSKGDVAAYISEPIIMNLGVEIPSQEYFDIVQNACKKYGTVFIIDEVATGFGRTGKLFASEHYNLKPDIMCLGKGLTGGYGALGATIMTEELAKSMEVDFSFYSTFGWHPLNTAATIANLKYLLKHKNTILKNVTEMSKYFANRLSIMKFKYHPTIGIKGLAIAIEFKEAGYAQKIVSKSLEKHLLMSTLTPFIFTIDRNTAKKGLDILENSL